MIGLLHRLNFQSLMEQGEISLPDEKLIQNLRIHQVNLTLDT